MSLQIIQKRLKAPKSQYNSFGKYKYRNLEDIQEAVKPLLAEFSYSLVFSDTIEEIGGRVYVKATATIYGNDMKVVVSNTAYAREALAKKGMDESQITGACSSYARKYCLNGLFAIDDTKDADSMENKKEKVITDTPTDKSKFNKDTQLANAIAAYKRDGDFSKIEERCVLSDEDKKAIKNGAE